MTARILVLEDDESLRLVVTKALSRAGFDVRATASPQSAIDRMIGGDADLLVADVVLGQENFLDRIDEITRVRPDAPIIIVSAQTTAATAIHAAKRGARRYLPKPFDLDELTRAVSACLAAHPGRSGETSRPTKSGGYEGLLGRSRAMQTVFQALGRLSRVVCPVLLTGPEGSGRATAARALHTARGGRKLIELGPARLDREGPGAATGEADGLLLRRADMWSERAAQQVREWCEAQPATNVYVTGSPTVRNALPDALYFLIGAGLVELPPLRDREGDLDLIVDHVWSRLSPERSLSGEVRTALSRWAWPGEVRELEFVLTRLSLCEMPSAEFLAGLLAQAGEHAEALEAAVIDAASRAFASGQAEPGRSVHDRVDAALIEAALSRTGGVRRDAATLLGWNRNTLARRIEALNLDV